MKKNRADIDEETEGIPYEKGRAFERDFAQFMKSDLNWTKIRVGASIQGHHNAKGTSIDVIGERLDEWGIKYRSIAIKWLVGSGIGFVATAIWYIQRWANDGLFFALISLVLMLAGFTFLLLSEHNNKQNAWVECKNLKTKVTINHVSKMIREFEDYKKSRDDSHRFTHYYFASASGYVENALKMATENNIVCFVKKGKSFEQVKYWNE